MLPYVIRELEPDALHLLFSSWSRGFRYATKETRRTPSRLYFRAERDLIDEVLARYPLLLAAMADNVVLGWLCAEATEPAFVLHAIFVKPEYRGVGVARALFREALARLDQVAGPGQVVTHVPDRLKDLAVSYGLTAVSPESVVRRKEAV